MRSKLLKSDRSDFETTVDNISDFLDEHGILLEPPRSFDELDAALQKRSHFSRPQVIFLVRDIIRLEKDLFKTLCEIENFKDNSAKEEQDHIAKCAKEYGIYLNAADCTFEADKDDRCVDKSLTDLYSIVEEIRNGK